MGYLFERQTTYALGRLSLYWNGYPSIRQISIGQTIISLLERYLLDTSSIYQMGCLAIRAIFLTMIYVFIRLAIYPLHTHTIYLLATQSIFLFDRQYMGQLPFKQMSVKKATHLVHGLTMHQIDHLMDSSSVE